MRLHYAHHGRQFFFLTICVRGRKAVLSQLPAKDGGSGAPAPRPRMEAAFCSGAPAPRPRMEAAFCSGAPAPRPRMDRPILSRAGECVKALWRAVHGLNPALTASDYVIMPDHVHLLLIVNYEVDPHFNPLVFIHWFMEESARMIAKDGGCAPAPLPAVLPSGAGCAPAPLPPLPRVMRRFYDPRLEGGAGAVPPSVADFWESRFWLDLSFDSRQLSAIRRYIRGNPARALWKRQNPDMFVCRQNFRHPVLDPALPWSACGDLTLLANPFLVAVSLTRKKTLAEHEPEIAALVEKARQGWILVCGFLSPGEKELGRRLRAEPNTRWIKTMAQGLPPRFDPSLEDSRFLAAHRQLLLSALPIGAPFDWNTCHAMNAHAAAMCRRARGEE